MQLYYEILGLNPGASQDEIKRAYFKLIRKHSPESDPEGFQQIRAAYEQLKNAPMTPEGPAFPTPADPWAQKMLEQIETYKRQRNHEKYRDACEEAWKHFPDEIQFLYMLNMAQRECKNTGKAVKSAELLIKKEPENKWFHRELAFSYMERGFTKKAISAFEKAYALGCQDIDFLLMYGNLCLDNFRYDKGLPVLIEIIRQDKKWSKQDMKSLLETHLCLLTMNYHQRSAYLSEILDSFCRILEQYSLYIKPYLSEICLIISRACTIAPFGSADYDKVIHLFDLIRSLCSTDEDREMVDANLDEYHYNRMVEDSRIGSTIQRYIDAFYELTDFDSAFQKYALLDTQLCMIEERDTILAQAKILQEEYPQQYEKMADFIKKLESEKNLPILKSSLQKTYRRMEPIFSYGYYYKNYPQEQEKAKGTCINKGQEDEPYVRPTRKIGRNDPCPCGSGKKYKHCCMNK